MPTLMIVDDHPLFRAGLRSALAWHAGLLVVAEAADAQSAYAAVASSHPDVVLLDLALPGTDGIEIARELRRRDKSINLLAISADLRTERMAEAFGAGIRGYATKAQPIAEIVEAILTVAGGQRYLAPAFSAEVVEQHQRKKDELDRLAEQLSRLTRRERQIFALTVRGLSCESIALQLSISKRTVDTHRSRILQKLRVRNAMDLVQFAARLGLMDRAGAVAR